jgi:hypothetical protein
MVHTVWLTAPSTYLNIVREASLSTVSLFSSKGSDAIYPHRRMQGPRYFIILFQPGAASQDLRQPELTHSTLHVPNFPLGRRRCLDPLGRFSAHTTDHVGVSKSLWCALLRLEVQSGRNWLCDTGV